MRMRIRRNPLRKRLASTRIAPIKHIHLLSSARGRLLFRRHRRICSTQRDLRVLPPTRSSSVGRGSRRRAELHADVHVLRLDRERLLDDEVVRRVGEGDVEAPEDAREDQLGPLARQRDDPTSTASSVCFRRFIGGSYDLRCKHERQSQTVAKQQAIITASINTIPSQKKKLNAPEASQTRHPSSSPA